jgi:hypothetical protein
MADDLGWGDPGEKQDLAAEHPELVGTMTRALDAWLESCR